MGDSIEKGDSTVQYAKHAEEEYKALKTTSLGNIIKDYSKNCHQNAEEYGEFFDTLDMVQLVKKSTKPEDIATEELRQKLEQMKKKNEFGGDLIEQSQTYKLMNEREERKKSIEEAKKLQQLSLKKPDTISPESVMEIMDSYEGKYSIRGVQKKDKDKLQDLRALAKSKFEENKQPQKDAIPPELQQLLPHRLKPKNNENKENK